MGLKKIMVMKVGLVLFLMGLSATTSVVDARFDASGFLTEVILLNGENSGDTTNYFTKSTTRACCNSCVCNFSNPPQCQCFDVGVTCHSACRKCYCTRSKPPQCRCADVNPFCYDKCPSTTKAGGS